MIRNASLSLLASVFLLSLGACKSETMPPPEAPPMPAATTTTTSSTYTVGDTFGALRAIHAAEVEHGQLAMKKASDPRVKDFAERIVNDHKIRMQKDERLMSGLGVTPKENAVSQQIKSAADQQTARLNAMTGTDFDRAYVEEQVNYYRAAIDTFDKDLLPNARDPQIKAEISEARMRANQHLKEAQDLRVSLIGK